jgi:dephospho-CoA kinase
MFLRKNKKKKIVIIDIPLLLENNINQKKWYFDICTIQEIRNFSEIKKKKKF